MDNQPTDNQALNLAKAIKRAETGEGDTYNAKGASGEFGAYQFMPDTYKAYAKKYLGDENAQPTIENQNKIAYSFVKEKKDAGYNPAQIASMWNAGEGRPNAYKENFRGVNDKGVAYDTPAYAEKVSNYYTQLKGQQPATQQPQTVQEQKQQLIDQGQPVSTQEDRAKPTFVGGIIRDIARPVATLLARPIQLAKALGGATEDEQTIKSKYLGDITTSKSGKDVLKDVGRGIETVSLGVGTGAAKNVVAGAGKKTIGKLVLQGAKEGLAAGSLGGAGSAIEQGKSAGNVLLDTAIGGGLGAATGGVLGGTIPAVGRAIGFGKNVGKATGVLKATEADAAKAMQSIAEEYERAAGTGLRNSFRKQQITRSGELKPWSQTLAEYGIVPQEGPNKTWDVSKALDDIASINEEFANTKQQFIQNENGLFNIDEAIKNAEAKIDDTLKSEVARNKAKQKKPTLTSNKSERRFKYPKNIKRLTALKFITNAKSLRVALTLARM